MSGYNWQNTMQGIAMCTSGDVYIVEDGYIVVDEYIVNEAASLTMNIYGYNI